MVSLCSPQNWCLNLSFFKKSCNMSENMADCNFSILDPQVWLELVWLLMHTATIIDRISPATCGLNIIQLYTSSTCWIFRNWIMKCTAESQGRNQSWGETRIQTLDHRASTMRNKASLAGQVNSNHLSRVYWCKLLRLQLQL